MIDIILFLLSVVAILLLGVVILSILVFIGLFISALVLDLLKY